MAVGGGVVEASGELAELGGEDHADRYGRPVAPLVALVLLDGVGQGVAVVEDLPQAGLLEVAGDDLGLDPHRAFDQLRGVRPRGRAGALGVGLDEVEDDRVGDEAGLDDLGHAGDVVVDRQRVQRGEVAEHTGRMGGRRPRGSCPRRC